MKFRYLTIACIMVSIISTKQVYADNGTTKVSMENIEKIVMNNNIDLKKADNNLKAKIKYYDELEDDIDKLEKSIQSNQDKKKTAADEDAKNNLEITIKADKETLRNKQEEYDNKTNELKKLRMAYNSKLKETVINAQNKYIDYLDSLSKKQIKEDQLKYNNEENKILKTKYEMGYSSKNEYNNNYIDVWTAETEYNQAVSDEIIKQKELKNSLGINDEKISVEDNIKLEMQKISQINFNNDLNEMLNNNMDIKNKKIDLDEISDKKDKRDSEKYEEDNAELSLKQSKNDAKIAFEKAYNDLITSYNTLNLDMNKMIKTENDNAITGIKLSFGETSKRKVEKQKLALNSEKVDLSKEENELYVNYMKYLRMKEGYSVN